MRHSLADCLSLLLLNQAAEHRDVVFASHTGDNQMNRSPMRMLRTDRYKYISTSLSLYEGGIRMPLLVRWPGRVPAGRVDEETVIAGMDFFPSLAAIAGAPLPEGPPLDGKDLSSALLGRPVERAAAIRWHYPNDIKPGNPRFRTPELAIREGRWKLLVEEDGSGTELYDLEADPRETTNLAERQAAVSARLKEQLLGWWRTLPRRARARQAVSGSSRAGTTASERAVGPPGTRGRPSR